jgi:hypothetical protein
MTIVSLPMMPPPSRSEFLLEKILEQLIELNQRLTPVEEITEIEKMQKEDINVKLPEPIVDVYEFLEKDDSISINTKKNYSKHLGVLELMIDNSVNEVYKKEIQEELKCKICDKYKNLNSRISYLSSLKYILKALKCDDLCNINGCFQENRNELNKQKSLNSKSKLSSITKAEDIWKQLLSSKKDTIPFLKMLIEIYDKLGVIRSSELIPMRLYYNADDIPKKSSSYICCMSKRMVIKDHKTKKSIGEKNIDISHLNLKLFLKNVKDEGLIFHQLNNPCLIYADSTGFNKIIKTHVNLDYTLLRQVKVSLVFAYGNEDEKKKLSNIHGTALDVMMKEYQQFVKLN